MPTDPLRKTAAALAVAVLTAGLAICGQSPALAAAAPVNLARTGTATASSVELDRADLVAAKVNDGDRATRWSSQYSDDSWVQIRLASPAGVGHVMLSWPNACARDFSLQTSTDGVQWTTVTRQQRDTCPRTDFIAVNSPGPVSYVRVQGHRRWAGYGYSLSEFEIWDSTAPAPAATLGLLPKPVSITQDAGAGYTLRPGAAIVATGAQAGAPAAYLAGLLRKATGYALPVVAQSSTVAPVVLDVGAGKGPAGQPAEGYRLSVTSARVQISADTAAGALNGVQTLRQLFPQWIESDTPVATAWTVPAVTVTDYPRLAYRGMMLDVARSFYPVDEVKEYIDAAAAYKINRLHLHLTDDQGWRIAIDNPGTSPSGIDYGLLTRVSGPTAMTYDAAGAMYGTQLGVTGFYTAADYAEIVRYAGINGMTVVPEVDVPAHTNAALHAVGQLNTTGARPRPAAGQTTVPANGTGSVGYSSLDAASPVTYEFVKHVLTRIAAMTPGPYLHIGGDEAHVTSHADYTTMVNAFTATVAGLGKTVIGWNEYAGSALPQNNAIVQYWNGDQTAVAAAVNNRGARVVLSPAANAYVPQKQDSRQPLGGTWACGGPCGLDRHYNWDPGTYLANVPPTAVLGVESALWGEFIRRVGQAEYYSFPRLIATAEVGWTPQAQRDYADFTTRLSAAGGRLTVGGHNFFPTAGVGWRTQAVGGPVTVATGAPAGARWTVTAPGAVAGAMAATVTWNDGRVESLTAVAARAASIPQMWINGTIEVTSRRTFSTPGTYTGRLSVRLGGDAPVEATLSVTVTAA
jgi:hexosaminidase